MVWRDILWRVVGGALGGASISLAEDRELGLDLRLNCCTLPGRRGLGLRCWWVLTWLQESDGLLKEPLRPCLAGQVELAFARQFDSAAHFAAPSTAAWPTPARAK
jgi:hypothetical protein